MEQENRINTTWEEAAAWVDSNMKFILQIASPYRRYMAADNGDLHQEAIIAAFNAFRTTREKGVPEKFDPFFRVIFRTNCIKLASGIPSNSYVEIHNLPAAYNNEGQEKYSEKKKIEIALSSITKKQRTICEWLLEQPVPVSTLELAKEFKISRRHAFRMIRNSIKRIAGAHMP
jgi:RNA polymerase sigma factor (sigma-70 family)